MADPFSNSFVVQITIKNEFLAEAPIAGFIKGMPLLKNVEFGEHDFQVKPSWSKTKPIKFFKFEFAKEDPSLTLRFEKFLAVFEKRYWKVKGTDVDLGNLFLQTCRDTIIFVEI